MQESTISRKQAAKVIASDVGSWLVGRVIYCGRIALDELSREMGRMIVKARGEAGLAPCGGKFKPLGFTPPPCGD